MSQNAMLVTRRDLDLYYAKMAAGMFYERSALNLFAGH